MTIANDTTPAPPTPLPDRRRALGLGLTATVAGLAMVVGAVPASAASGANLVIGQANDSGADTTSLAASNSGSTLYVQNSFSPTISSDARLASYDTGVIGEGTTRGVYGVGPTGVLAAGSGSSSSTGLHATGNTAVYAYGDSTGVLGQGPLAVNGDGVVTGVQGSGLSEGGVFYGGNVHSPPVVSTAHVGRGDGIGGSFAGNTSNLLLTPGASAAPPNVAHTAGEIFVGSDVGILVCVAPGTPGTWVRLGFNPTAPTRVCDTRAGSGQAFAGQPIGPGQELVLPLVGVAPLPGSGVSAVVMNLTMATCTADGWLTVYPNGQTRPNASNLNFAANQSPKANLVVCGVGVGPGSASPAVRVYNPAGTTNVIADVFGFYS